MSDINLDLIKAARDALKRVEISHEVVKDQAHADRLNKRVRELGCKNLFKVGDKIFHANVPDEGEVLGPI